MDWHILAVRFRIQSALAVPVKGWGFGVVCCKVRQDECDPFLNAVEMATGNGLGGDQGEKSLHWVEP
jgi:hypothetical protein